MLLIKYLTNKQDCGIIHTYTEKTREKMITPAKLEQLQNINADQLTDMMSDAGYAISDEPFITTHFEGVITSTGNKVNFLYCGMYHDTHVTDTLQYSHLNVSYDTVTGTTSVDYAA